MFPFYFLLKLAILAVYACVVTLILLWLLMIIAGHYKRSGERGLYRFTQGCIAIVLLPFLLFALGGLYAVFIEPNWIQVKTIKIYSPDFPGGLSQLKIVHLSDLHVKKIGRRERRLIELVNGLKPDVILNSGDYNAGKDGWENSLWVMKELKASYGIYTTLSNSDVYFITEEQALDMFEQIGVRILLHENVPLDFGPWGKLWLAGLSGNYFERALFGKETHWVDETFAGIPATAARILLAHNQDYASIEKVAAYRPQLVLSGNSRGGQLGLPFIRQFSDYANCFGCEGGLFLINDLPVYVSRGVGLKTLGARFFCRPEVTVIQFEKGTSENATRFSLKKIKSEGEEYQE